MLEYLRYSKAWVSAPAPLTGVVLAIGCCLVVQGCGYTAVSTLPQSYHTIYVPAARSSVKEYDLQAPLTNALIRKFTVHGRLRVMDAERADLRLETNIKRYSLAPITYDNQDRVAQFRVTLVAAARLVEARTGKEIWSKDRIDGTSSFMMSRLVPSITPRGNTNFFASTVRSFPSGNQGEATTEALEDLANQILYLTVERW